jgi:hypothetical protein
MGGIGSGGWNASGRATVGSVVSLDANRMQREGCLRAGWSGGWQWSRDGEKSGTDRIGLRIEADCVVMRYRVSAADGPWQEIVETVPIERVACGFGGSRAYLRCPGVVGGVACGRRVVKLYMRGRYFLCRRCHDLAYPSQSECARDRALRRVDKICTRLGGEPDATRSFPPRPKGMWRRTYARLCEEALGAEDVALRAMMDGLERCLRRLPRRA